MRNWRRQQQIGHLDSVEDGIVSGWAIDSDVKSPATLHLYINEGFVAAVSCSQYRADLQKACKGTGWHGFTYSLPAPYASTKGKLTVRFAGSGRLLPGGRVVLPDFTTRCLSSAVVASAVLAKGLWCVDNLELGESNVTIEGWCIPPGVMPVSIALAYNGEVIADLARFPRDDIAALLGWNSDEFGLGFRGNAPRLTAASTHTLTFGPAHSKLPFDPNQMIHYRSDDEPLPPEPLRLRVHGSADAVSFVKEGFSAFARIEQVLAKYFSKSIHDFEQTLDWGCGSGRLLRFFANSSGRAITGIDIDTEAIDWCRRSFPRAQFLAVNTEPPTAIPNETFDLIYGTSVLTEEDQSKWLMELERIAKPHAVVLLTTLGDRAWWGSKIPYRLLPAWRLAGAGFLDAGRNTDLDDLGIGDYYRNVFVSQDYIARNWSRYFDIVDFLPMAIGNLQDLTILRKRR